MEEVGGWILHSHPKVGERNPSLWGYAGWPAWWVLPLYMRVWILPVTLWLCVREW